MGVKNASAITAILLGAVVSTGAAPPVVPEPAGPDLLFFARNVAADLHERCAGCHSDPESSGRYRLEPLDNLARPSRKLLQRNYRATLKFLDPVRPDRSALLRKAAGGASHGGGALLEEGGRDYVTLLQFAQGATLTNLPPEAILARTHEAAPGARIRIDGTLSGDPDGDRLRYSWRALGVPGAQLRIIDRGDGTIDATAPKPGVYGVELRVHDGKLGSLAARTGVIVDAGFADDEAHKPAARDDSGAPQMPRPGVAEPSPRPAKPKPEPRAATTSSFLESRLDPNRLRLIRRLHYDLKWRGPTIDEFARWYARPHEEMVDAFLADEETWAAWYERELYYFLLLDRFRPKAHRLTTLPQRLKDRKVDVPLALQEIVRSQFFNARNPGNDTYCTVVLEQCLGLVVQERKNKRVLDLSKKMYDGYKVKLFRIEGDSQADFVRIVFRQPDFFRHLLARTYKELHGEEIARKQLARDIETASSAPFGFRKVLRAWLVAEPYAAASEARTKAEIPYVRALFLDTLGRQPTYDELRNVRNAFLSLADPTPIRLVMGRMLLSSREARIPATVADARRFVRQSYLRLLARQPTDQELAAFAGGLRSDPRITPRVVLWTLLSSAEYQTY